MHISGCILHSVVLLLHPCLQTSIATVVTVEQAALYLAKGDTGNAEAPANMFLATLATLDSDGTARGGGAFACIRDTDCFLGVLSDTFQGLTDAATAPRAAEQPSESVVQQPVAAALDSAPVDGFKTGVQLFGCFRYQWSLARACHSFSCESTYS